MNLVSAFVVFSVTWFLALYCLLPIGVRSQEEAGDNIPTGAMAGAPSKPNLRLKAIGARMRWTVCLVWKVKCNFE